MDITLRLKTNKVAQHFRLRNHETMWASGENGIFQTKENTAVPYGTIMVNNFLLDFNLDDTLEELKEYFRSKFSLTSEEVENILQKVKEIHGMEGNTFKHIDRVVVYSTMRYIIRDYCQQRQKTLRKKIDKKRLLR
jgi:hypothetical protein